MKTYWNDEDVEQQVLLYDSEEEPRPRIFCNVDDAGRFVPPLCAFTGPITARGEEVRD